MTQKNISVKAIVQEVHDSGNETCAIILYDMQNYRFRTVHLKKDDANKIGIIAGKEVEIQFDPKSFKVSKIAQVVKTWVSTISLTSKDEEEPYNYRHDYA